MPEILHIEFDYSFLLYGIITHVKPEKLCVALNKYWNVKFQRNEDIEVFKKKDHYLLMSNYYAESIQNSLQFNIYSNKINHQWIFNECKNIDYLIKIEGDTDDFDFNISHIPFVLHYKKIPIELIKNKQYLM